MKDFYGIWPEKFNNKTNGVTPRRWVVLINPKLSNLITDKIGDGWQTSMKDLRKLEEHVDDPNFLIAWQKCKAYAKQNLADHIWETQHIKINPESIYDVQAKRIHEYKRQHLSVLHIIRLYNQIKENPQLDIVPRTFIFSGKAAPGYHIAKLMIKLITSVGDVVNNDPDIQDKLKVVFLPDFNVTNSQRIYPAADLSEQISTAGKEASGTGNMKFAMNGALTIGTLDGANIEIMEEVGKENFFLFGNTTETIDEIHKKGYRPRDYYEQDEELKKCMDMISLDYFSGGQKGLFWPISDHLLNHDDYMLLADFRSYVEAQDRVSDTFRNMELWATMSILNTARIGKFSSDRTIQEYCGDIWKVDPVKIVIPEYNPMHATKVHLGKI